MFSTSTFIVVILQNTTFRLVAISRLEDSTNMGGGAAEVKYFILILCPSNIKGEMERNATRFLILVTCT